MSEAARAREAAGTRPQVWLGSMLLALHAGLAWGIAEWWQRAFLLAHFGLFLIWQPLWRGEREIEPRYALLVVVVGLFLAAASTWWLMAVWVGVLFALIGGAVPGTGERRQRLASMLAALYLLSMLLIWVVPHLFANTAIEPSFVPVVQYGLPLLALAILAIPVEARRAGSPLAVDLFYSVILFLLVAALVLGSFVVKEVSRGSYPLALAQTLFAIALVLVMLSWLWNPRSGFVGFGYLLSRYLMSLGLPFERWVQRLARLAEEQSQPQRFLALALEHMRELPWVTGVEWEAPLGRGEVGERSRFSTDCSFHDLRLRIFTKWSLSPALLLHLNLVTQMVGHFYDAKRREQIQRQSAYTQAIYETGARLTHDVKNLLQSLRSLCTAAESCSPDQAQALRALMQRQLPQITQRLNVTLDKLRSPQRAGSTEVEAAAWWSALTQRYTGRAVEFEVDGPAHDLRVPQELFDSVADNLIENALAKTGEGKGVRVRVTFSPARGGTLAVCDDGAPVPAQLAGQILRAPVPSQSGLGVGLYQSARAAAEHGYRLALAANEPGRVCFVLTPEPGTA